MKRFQKTGVNRCTKRWNILGLEPQKLLRHAGTILRRLSTTREKVHVQEFSRFSTRLWFYWKNFTLRFILEHRQTHSGPKIFTYLNPKVAPNSIDRAILRQHFSLKNVREIFISLFQSPYANSRIRVHTYGALWCGFTKKSSVRQTRSLPQFFCNFIIKMIAEIILSSPGNSGADIWSNGKLFDREHPIDVVAVSETQVSCSFFFIV